MNPDTLPPLPDPEETSYRMRPIARIRSDFRSKFGIPRQSGLVPELEALVIFEPEYRSPDAVRGLDGFSYIWLLWAFSESVRDAWSPTVRPPRLGGNARMGVFATRSPFRPNPIGLSSVRLERVSLHPELGPVLCIRGADLMDGTPIFDIKPYAPSVDCHPDAESGFIGSHPMPTLTVIVPPELEALIPPEKRRALAGILAQDPRPRYQQSPDRIYGIAFAGMDVRFSVSGAVLTVREIRKA